MSLAVRGFFWIGLYLAVAVAPLVFALAGVSRPGQGFLTDFAVALGFVGLAMMGLQFALVARFKTVAAPFGMDAVLQFHRQVSYVALAFILAHPLLLILADRDTLALLNPLTAPWRARLGLLAVAALVGLVALSVWRRRLRVSYEVWQLTHGVFAVVIVAAALAHVGLVGYYVGTPWKQALWLAMSVAFVGLLAWVRVLKPLALYRRPWRLEEVVPERGNTWTMVLRPEGHAGLRFEPGQFAWLVVNRSPFSVTHHPFSFSSSAEQADRVALSVKALGDFTSEVAGLKLGSRVYVDGPHGVFTPDRFEGPGFVLIGGGVGVTPLVSMLRTLADRGDARPCHLFLGNRDWDDITFREEIWALQRPLDLKVVHVLLAPDEDWEGERGFIDEKLLRRHLPGRRGRLQYFVCGPGPMMDAMEDALARLGVPAERVHTERFDLV